MEAVLNILGGAVFLWTLGMCVMSVKSGPPPGSGLP